MNYFKSFTSLFFILLTSVSLAIPDVSKDEIKKWGSRSKFNLGTLLNIPIGSNSDQVKEIEKLVREIVYTLKPDLAKTHQLTFGVYPSSSANAFMEKVDVKQHRNVIEKIYKLDSSKPVYHLGVSIGLFAKMKTKNRIAFVIAHELTHLLEGHVDDADFEHDATAEKWWSSQRYESIADHKGIELMLGKYDLSGAIEALWILAELSVDKNVKNTEATKVKRALKEFLATHHDRGVRISMAQAYVEYLRNKKQEASPLADKTLSDRLGKPRNNRSFEPAAPLPLTAEERANTEKIIDSMLNDLASGLFTTEEGMRISVIIADHKKYANNVIQDFYRRDLTRQDAEYFINRDIQRTIDRKDLTLDQKVAVLFTSMDIWSNTANSIAGFSMAEYQQPYERALFQIIKQQQVNWEKVYELIRIPPYMASLNWLIGALSKLPAGEGLMSYIVESNLYSTNHSWIKKGDPREMQFQNINTFLTSMPFVILEGKKRNDFKNRDIESPYYEKYYQALSKNLAKQAAYFSTKKFWDDLNTADVLNEKIKQFLCLADVFENNKDPYFTENYREEMLDNPFVKEMLKVSVKIKTRVLQERKSFLSQLNSAHDELSVDSIRRLSEHFNLSGYQGMGLSENERKDVAELFHKLVQTSLYTSELIYVKNVSNVIQVLLQYDLIPVGNSQQNLDALILLGMLDIPTQEAERIKLSKTIDKLMAGIQNSELKKVILATRYESFAARYAKALRSEDHKQNLLEFEQIVRKYDIKQKSDLYSKIPFDGPDTTKAMGLSLYFETAEKLSQEESKAQLGVLGLFRMDELQKKFAAQFGLSELDQILRRIYFYENLSTNRQQEFSPALLLKPLQDPDEKRIESSVGNVKLDARHADEITFLLDIFYQQQNSISDFGVWGKKLRSLLKISTASLDYRPEYKEGFELKFLELSKQGTDPKAYYFVRNSPLIRTLSEKSLVPVMLAEVKRRMNGSSDPTRLKEVFDQVDLDQKLKSTLPEVYDGLRKQAAEEFKLQPHNINTVFPRTDLELNTQNTKGMTEQVRGLSAIAYYARTRTFDEQIDLIEYLMGRKKEMPEYIVKAQKKLNLPLHSIIYGAKIKMEKESELMRAFLINSVISGPDGMVNITAGKEAVLNHLMKSLKNSDVAREMAEALLRSMGTEGSLAVAYVLAQKTEANGLMDEGKIFRALLESFGVAGIKLGQYLAFTSELVEYRNALSELQDSAMPVSYLEILHVVRLKLGENWSQSWEIVRSIGSGSVNLAIVVRSATTGEQRVISILREDIEVTAKKNFRDLTKFVNELIKGPNGHKFAFLPGLLKIIETSVTLEFDKQNSLNRQKDAKIIYTRDYKGWKVRVPEAFEVINNAALSMGVASGKSAAKIREKNPALYEEVMPIVLNIEFAHLMNSGFVSRTILSAIANPDLHDGQVMIDEESKTITILDFGQAVEISKTERDLGLHILRILNVTHSEAELRSQVALLQSSLKATQNLSDEEFKNLFEKNELMDRFVYLLGVAGARDWKMPLATVHFILGVNRVIKLGDNLGYNITRRLRTIITTRALTSSTELGYYISKLLESAINLEVQVSHKFKCEGFFK